MIKGTHSLKKKKKKNKKDNDTDSYTHLKTRWAKFVFYKVLFSGLYKHFRIANNNDSDSNGNHDCDNDWDQDDGDDKMGYHYFPKSRSFPKILTY